MTQKDHLKLLNAGFIIIRKDYQRLIIKCLDSERRAWHDMYKDFPNKTRMENKVKELLSREDIVED